MSTTMFPVRSTKDAVVNAGEVALPISRTDGKKGKSGICIVAPAVSDAVLQVISNAPHGAAWIKDQIDSLRSRVASETHKKGNVISSITIGVDSLLAAMKMEVESQRLTKESIAAWFAADLAPLLTDAIKHKYPNAAQDKIDAILKPYLEGYQVCAAREGNRSMSAELRASLIKQFDKLPEDYENTIAVKVMEILDTIPETVQMLEAL